MLHGVLGSSFLQVTVWSAVSVCSRGARDVGPSLGTEMQERMVYV